MMRILHTSLLLLTLLVFLTLPPGRTIAADSSKVDVAAKQIETGAKKIGQGVEETAKGIGNTVVEGTKHTGEKMEEVGKAAEPQAKNAWNKVKAGAHAFSSSVKNFFSKLFES
jgi:hypothetical protein